MSNVKRYFRDANLDDHGVLVGTMTESPAGEWVKFTDYERLRDALEIIAAQVCSCHSNHDNDWHSTRCSKFIAMQALAPAGGAPRQAEELADGYVSAMAEALREVGRHGIKATNQAPASAARQDENAERPTQGRSERGAEPLAPTTKREEDSREIAAGSLEEADAPKAARKDKESD